MDKLLYGKSCSIAPQIKKQKKSSKYRLLNWLYEKMYGYKYESTLPEGTDIIFVNNTYIFRNQETFDKVKDFIDKENIENDKCE